MFVAGRFNLPLQGENFPTIPGTRGVAPGIFKLPFQDAASSEICILLILNAQFPAAHFSFFHLIKSYLLMT